MTRILLVDDDAHVSRIMDMWLARHGYEVVITSNGAEALDVVRAGGIDLIVSDLNMPILDGAEMVRALRDEGRDELPVILLTARCERDSLIKELGPLGVTVYPKPFVPSRLVIEVEQRLANRPLSLLAAGGSPTTAAPRSQGTAVHTEES